MKQLSRSYPLITISFIIPRVPPLDMLLAISDEFPQLEGENVAIGRCDRRGDGPTPSESHGPRY
jgi:hypothetical protein